MNDGISTIRLADGLRAEQVLQQALADDVQRHPPAARGPDVADFVQQLRDIEHRIGPQREHGQARCRDRPVAIDERGISESDLAEDRRVAHSLTPTAVISDRGS
jgi:hypothetical protein